MDEQFTPREDINYERTRKSKEPSSESIRTLKYYFINLNILTILKTCSDRNIQGKEGRREKGHEGSICTGTTLTFIPSHLFLLWFPYFQKPWRICETGWAGQVEAKKAVSLATVAVWKAGKYSLSHFSFHFLQFLKGGQMLCVKFTLQFCFAVPSVS